MTNSIFTVLSDEQIVKDQRNKTLKDILKFVEDNNTFADWAIFQMLIKEILFTTKDNE